MEQLFPFILIAFALLIFLVLPARQRKAAQAKQQALRESLVPGTPVMLTSGLHGTIAAVGAGTVDVEIAPGLVTTWAQAAVMEVRPPAGPVVDDAAGGARGGIVEGNGNPTDTTR